MSYPVQPPPVATAPAPAPTGRPATVTAAAALLWLMAVAGLIYAITTLAIVPGTVDRFREVTGGPTGDTDPEYYVAVVWLGAAVALALAVILFALFLVIGLALRRGSSAARIATLVMAVLGVLAGAVSLLTVLVERSGDPVPSSLGEQLTAAYPTGWVVTNAGLSVAQILGYVIVAVLVLMTPRAFFRKAAPSTPPAPGQPFYGTPYGQPPVQGYGAGPGVPGYGAGPGAPGYGAGPGAPGYGAGPDAPGYGAGPGVPGYSAGPGAPGYGSGPAVPAYPGEHPGYAPVGGDSPYARPAEPVYGAPYGASPDPSYAPPAPAVGPAYPALPSSAEAAADRHSDVPSGATPPAAGTAFTPPATSPWDAPPASSTPAPPASSTPAPPASSAPAPPASSAPARPASSTPAPADGSTAASGSASASPVADPDEPVAFPSGHPSAPAAPSQESRSETESLPSATTAPPFADGRPNGWNPERRPDDEYWSRPSE